MSAPAAPRTEKRRERALAVMGVAGAALLAVNANVLAARWYERWDLTSDALYTLSAPTRESLRALRDRVEVVVLLSRSDPLALGVRQLLAAYRSETEKLDVRYVDPDQAPAEFLAVQQKYGILAGKAEDGRVVTDTSVVIARGERHWFITPDDLMQLESDSGRVRPRLEQALTEGIVNVLGEEKAVVCFTRGHQELGLHDAGPEGLLELRERIEKSNYSTEERDLPGTAKEPLAGCRLVVVAGPKLPFDVRDARTLTAVIQGGASALLLVGPVLAEAGSLRSSGLEPVFELAGVEPGGDLVLENDAAARLPRGMGEVFFATPRAHAVTAGLLKDGAKIELRVLLSEAQSLRPTGDQARPLLVSSNEAVGVKDLAPFLDGRAEAALDAAKPGEKVLAVARELDARSAKGRAPRIVAVGSSNVAQSRSFRDSALYGDRLFVENAVSWLAARPALVSVPEKPPREVGLALSEESLGEVLRYVLVYMPVSAALLGAFVLLRRRAVEKRSRAAPRATESP